MTYDQNVETERFIRASPRSKTLFDEGSKYLPGASTRVHWDPYPLFWERGDKFWVWDVDGVMRLDFISNNTALPMGHGHPVVVEALKEQVEKGLSYSGPHEIQVKFAKLICQRLPSVESVRFTNSGTEATMKCVHAARAFTGRSKVAKVDGSYHGSHDVLAFNMPGELGGIEAVPSLPNTPGGLTDATVIIPFNRASEAVRIIEENANELAAVMLEPMMGGAGFIEAELEFLEGIREVTSRHEIILIFDEVVTLRLGSGGGQEFFDVHPDLTALGKSIGGGATMGAFGGRREIMNLFDPTSELGASVSHAGSYNGNPLSLVAGYETAELMTPEIYAHSNHLGSLLREGVRAVSAEFDVAVQVTGLGPLIGIHFNDEPIKTYSDTLSSDNALKHRVFLGLLNEGIWISPQLFGCVSAPMTDNEVDSFVEAFGIVLYRNR